MQRRLPPRTFLQPSPRRGRGSGKTGEYQEGDGGEGPTCHCDHLCALVPDAVAGARKVGPGGRGTQGGWL